jgi:hypothetical protein
VIKSYNIWPPLFFGVALAVSFNALASERSLEADVSARAEYNDNIFLTDQEHDAVSGLIVTPTLSGIIKEENWEAKLNAGLRINKYSDSNLDSNDQLFDLTGRYLAQRNIFSLNINHNLDSNLRSTSDDFGVVVGRRVNRKMQSITPQYTYLLTERSILQFSYTYTDVDYIDAEDTGFTPYITENVSGALIYNLTERDKLTFSFSVVDYRSQNKLITYQLYSPRIGLDHEFTETLSGNFSIGVSNRNSTNRQTQTFDFFGRPITISQEIDSKSRGLVFDFGMKQLLETGQLEGTFSRSDTTDSFGGLNQINRIGASYSDKLSELWRYTISSRYDDITSVGRSSTTDRNTFYFDSMVSYSIAINWNVNASYQYAARKFKSDASENRAPHSNRVYLGLTYNFPPLSTF